MSGSSIGFLFIDSILFSSPPLEWIGGFVYTEQSPLCFPEGQLHYGNNPIIAVELRNDNILVPFNLLLGNRPPPSQAGT